MGNTKKQENYFIELVRFVFSVVIVYFHILNNNIMSFVGDSPEYLKLSENCKWSALIVECFLIIGGYFLYLSAERSKKRSFLELTMNRFFRLWPVLAVYTLLMVLVWDMNKQTGLFHLSMLHATGITLEENGIVWYIAPYFWSCTFIMGVLRKFDRKTSGLILAVIAYVGFAVNLNSTGGGFSRGMVCGVVSLAMLRCLAGVALGAIIAMVTDEFRKHYSSENSKKLYKGSVFVVCSLAEAAALAVLMRMFLFTKSPWNNAFVAVIVFTVFFVIAVNNGGLLSRALNLRIFRLVGRYSYSIYVMQQISFLIMRETLWNNEEFMSKGAFTVCAVSTLVSVLIGVVTYHIIEKPCMTLYLKWKKHHFA